MDIFKTLGPDFYFGFRVFLIETYIQGMSISRLSHRMSFFYRRIRNSTYFNVQGNDGSFWEYYKKKNI